MVIVTVTKALYSYRSLTLKVLVSVVEVEQPLKVSPRDCKGLQIYY